MEILHVVISALLCTATDTRASSNVLEATPLPSIFPSATMVP